MDLGEIPRRNARRDPKKVCLIWGDKRYTTQSFNERINQLANGLLDLGISKGDRVVVLLHNCSEYIELYFGLAKIGAIMVPLNTRLNAKEYIRYFTITSPSAWIISEQFQHVAAEIMPSLETVQHVLCVGEKTGEKQILYESLLSDSSLSEPSVDINENDAAVIFFTSGTTGLPRGAVWTHRNILEHMVCLQIDLPFSRDDKGLVVLPMFHGPVTIPITHQLLYVRACVVVSPYASFDPGQFLETIARENITCTFVVPTMLVQIVNFPEIEHYRGAIKQLRQIKYAAAPASAPVLKQAVELFGPILTQGYGSTETVGGVTYLAKEDHVASSGSDRRLLSVGKEYINVHIKIVDDNGYEVPPGEVGEVLVKGDKIFAGYWDMPEETAQVLKDGWLRTTDLGRFDQERYLYLAGRKKDMIISGGENIYPAEIEAVIDSYYKVSESAVVGVPDPTWGESVKAFVILNPGETATEQEIVDICLKSLGSYKKPKFVEFVDEFPRNSMGKVLKHLLKEQHLGRKSENSGCGS